MTDLYVCPAGNLMDKFVSEELGNTSGIPFGTWIQLTGSPGSGKTTFALDTALGLWQNGHGNIHIEHYDYEMGPIRAGKLYRIMGIPNDSFTFSYVSDPDKDTLLENIYAKANRLKELNKYLVVIIDSSDFIAKGVKEQIEVAKNIRLNRNIHSNLLIITINHMNKKGQMAGASEWLRYSDIAFSLLRKNGFIYISTLKNRSQTPDAPDLLKTYMDLDTRRLKESTEPDWFTNNELVKGCKYLVAKMIGKTDGKS